MSLRLLAMLRRGGRTPIGAIGRRNNCVGSGQLADPIGAAGPVIHLADRAGVKAVTKDHYHVDKSLGRQLGEERRARGQLAQKLQNDPEDISAYESGEKRVSADCLLRIAKALLVRTDERQRETAESDEERSEEAITHPAILDEGLRLNRAFARINNAEIRKTIVIVVDELTKSERAD